MTKIEIENKVETIVRNWGFIQPDYDEETITDVENAVREAFMAGRASLMI